MKKGIVYGIYNRCSHYIKSILWKSQQKRFCKIGTNGKVLAPPVVIGYEHISIGNNVFIGQDVRLEAHSKYGEQVFNPQIIIENNVTLTDRCYLSCINKIVLSEGALLGRDVFIADNSHGDVTFDEINIQPSKRPLSSKGPVIIKKNVWIGRQVTVLSGVTIGENSIIGANSVVNKDIPPNCVAAGNPAHVIKKMV